MMTTYTIKQVLHALEWPIEQQAGTVDRLLRGDPDLDVTAIAVAFTATQQVIQAAHARGANLLIVHEGLYYAHGEMLPALQEDPVYKDKQDGISHAGLAIYRNHDHVHRVQRDLITTGLIEQLAWESFVEKHASIYSIVNLQDASLRAVAAHLKAALGIPYVRIVGDWTMDCRRIGVMAGYRGSGANAIPLYESEQLDLLIVGEGPEWETPEYVRDAVQQGKRKGLIVLGHAESEEPGMRKLAGQLRVRFPDIPVYDIKEKPLFQLL